MDQSAAVLFSTFCACAKLCQAGFALYILTYAALLAGNVFQHKRDATSQSLLRQMVRLDSKGSEKKREALQPGAMPAGRLPPLTGATEIASGFCIDTHLCNSIAWRNRVVMRSQLQLNICTTCALLLSPQLSTSAALCRACKLSSSTSGVLDWMRFQRWTAPACQVQQAC